jgi:hypothetical protein
VLFVAVLAGSLITGGTGTAETSVILGEVQSLDGRGNNVFNPDWGRANTPYSRVGRARYADGRSQPVPGPNARRVSNRVFNDVAQNLFSETETTQWGFVWGQFLDHTFGLRQGRAPGDPDGEAANIPFDSADPLEEFTNDLGSIGFVRSTPAPGTGVSTPRQQVNTVSSYIDAHAVYGPTPTRLDWLRDGAVDGNPTNNRASLLLPGGDLPTRDARGDPAGAPQIEIDGRLRANPNRGRVAGDIRSNENMGLQATHTLFAREHNRIVGLLPNHLTEEQKFQIARRVVIAEQQFITYNEFLPAVGVNLPAYRGYNPFVNANLSNEFATTGYRAHSMIHGEFEIETQAARYTPEELNQLREEGVEVTVEGDDVAFAVPLNVAFFNPDLLTRLELGPVLQGFGLEPQYNNDEQIDNQLRSVLFQIPVPGNPECLDGPELPRCFRSVVDLGAIDIERGRDHGLPTYNQLRRLYGLLPVTTFRQITGEASEAFPADPELDRGNEINDPDSIDFTQLFDIDGNPLPVGAEEDAVRGVRRTPLAARLKAIYGSVENVDGFTGMLAEAHAAGSDFGPLQRAIWRRQFQALRDGDRFFYLNNPGLGEIRSRFGIDFRQRLGDVIANNTDIPRNQLADNVFKIAPEAAPAPPSGVAPRALDRPALPLSTMPGSATDRRRPRR